MSMKTKSLVLGGCLLVRVAFGGETITSFAKQSLGLDLASVPFGMTVQTNGEFKIVGPPLALSTDFADAGVSWMTNAASGNYSRDFPNRVLRFGFRDGRLVAVRISISAFLTGNDSGFEERRMELIQIQDALMRASPIHKLSFDDGTFRIRYGASCSTEPESLLVMEIQITPVETKKAP